MNVIAPGALTTIQDGGRNGLGSQGIAPSGAFDTFAARTANLLVGNTENAAGLECTLRGPTITFEQDAVVALAGSTFEAKLDDRPVPMNESFRARRGETLSVGRARDGARCFVAVRGGIDAPEVLGSRSTHVAAELGPSPLRIGDRLKISDAPDGPLRRIARDEPRTTVRAIAFASSAFLDAGYTVTSRADRTGVRLEGPLLEGREIDPQAMPLGAIQVPPDGNPIVLGPDRPITGGYAPLAAVIGADLGIIARARPGDTLRFVKVTIPEARAAWLERERALEAIEDLR